MNSLAGLAAANQARSLAGYRQGPVPHARRPEEGSRRPSRQFIDASVAVLPARLCCATRATHLHGNIGLAYMMRNREHDVDSALRHWQRMRSIAGNRMTERYSEFTQIGAPSTPPASGLTTATSSSATSTCRIGRDLPAPAGGPALRLEPVAEQRLWRRIRAPGACAAALRIRDQIADARRAWHASRPEPFTRMETQRASPYRAPVCLDRDHHLPLVVPLAARALLRLHARPRSSPASSPRGARLRPAVGR